MAWVTYDNFVPLAVWLESYKPSVVTNNVASWLHVENAEHKSYVVGNVDGAINDWNRYLFFFLSF